MSCLVLYFLFSSLFSLVCYGQNVFTVTRTSTKPFNDYDVFKVPKLNCTDSDSHCRSYHKEAFATQKKCTCKCPYGSSTFGFFGNSWKCLDNEELRTQAGCTKRFAEEQNSYPFKVIKADSLDWSHYYVVLKGKNCKIDLPSSRYLTCSGTWAKLHHEISSQHISSSVKEKINGGNYKYFFTIKQPPPTLKGQFISLSFKCLKVQCLLFKVAGVTKCNAGEKPRVTITEPTPSTSSSSTTLVQSPTPTKGNQGSSTKETSSGLIVAVVIIIILIIFIVIIVGYIFWKRRRGERIWLLDQCSHIVRKVRKPLSRSLKTKKKAEEEEEEEEEENNYNDESFYAEIPELPRLHTNCALYVRYPEQETQDTSLRQGRRSLTDETGYAVPVEFEDAHDQGYSNTTGSSFQNGTHDHARAQDDLRDTDGYTVPELDLNGYNAVQQTSTSKPDVVGNPQGRRRDRCSTADEEGYTVPGTDLPEYDVLEGPEGEVMYDNSSERNHDHLAACDDIYDVPETDLPEETNGFDSLPETDSSNHQGRQVTENAIKDSNQKEEGGNTTSNSRRTRRRPPSPPRATNRVVHDV